MPDNKIPGAGRERMMRATINASKTRLAAHAERPVKERRPTLNCAMGRSGGVSGAFFGESECAFISRLGGHLGFGT